MTLLAALGNQLAMHVRATARTGATPEDLVEAMLHVAVYAGGAARPRTENHKRNLHGDEDGAMTTSQFCQRDRSLHPPALTPDYKTRRALPPLRASVAANFSQRDHRADLRSQRPRPARHDLILNYAHDGEPVGERIVVHGRVLDENAKPVPNTLVEFWQGQRRRPLPAQEGHLPRADCPNFGGCGRALSDAEGRYDFRTLKPGAYPWRNFVNSWRPARIHFSVFGSGFAQRLIT